LTRIHGWARRIALLIVLCGVVLVCVPAALSQEPPVTVPASPSGGGGNPGPDPAPAPPPPSPPPPSPPASPPPAPPESPPPTYVPPPAAPSGPTAAEIRAAQQRAERERKRREAARKRAAEERQRRAAEKKIREATKKEAGEGYGLPSGTSLPPPPIVPLRVDEPEPQSEPQSPPTVPLDPASNVQANAASVIAPAPDDSGALNGAAPILLGLFGLSVLLLGLAALPPLHTHSAVGDLLIRRRFELGLLGTAVLVSAAVGLLIAVLSG